MARKQCRGAMRQVHDIAVIMTRPAGSNAAIANAIAPDIRVQLTIVESPLIAIEPLSVNVALGGTEAAIFTSSNAVSFSPEGQGRKAYCVGSKTTSEAISAGWRAENCGQDADALVQTLLDLRPKENLHHLSGVHLRGDVADRLKDAGLSVSQTAIYDQVPVPLSQPALELIRGDSPVLVPLFSPRSATQFVACSKGAKDLHLVVMSAAVHEALGDLARFPCEIAAAPCASGMVEAIEKMAKRISLG